MKQPKSTKQKISIEEVNNKLNKLFGPVGSSIEFVYNNRHVKGILVEPIGKCITLELEKDYEGGNETWDKNQIKRFSNRIVYNYNCT